MPSLIAPPTVCRNSSSCRPTLRRKLWNELSVASPTPTVGTSLDSTSVMSSSGRACCRPDAAIHPDDPPPTIRTERTRGIGVGSSGLLLGDLVDARGAARRCGWRRSPGSAAARRASRPAIASAFSSAAARRGFDALGDDALPPRRRARRPSPPPAPPARPGPARTGGPCRDPRRCRGRRRAPRPGPFTTQPMTATCNGMLRASSASCASRATLITSTSARPHDGHAMRSSPLRSRSPSASSSCRPALASSTGSAVSE